MPPAKAVLSAPRDAAKGVTLREIRQALQRGEFIYYYQPKVSMVSGRISGAEALLRWRRPDGSMIYPNEFIPVAESTGFITEVTIRMLERLVVDIARIRPVETGLVVSFNASARDFEDHRFVTALFRLFDRGQLAAEEIEVEVTESAALGGKAGLVEQLLQLRNRRVALAMDDFGAGYASIDALSRLPFTRRYRQMLWNAWRESRGVLPRVAFDQFSIHELRTGAHERNQVRCVDLSPSPFCSLEQLEHHRHPRLA